MTDVRLYLVKADHSHVDDFDSAVVYAHNPDDAIGIVNAEITKGVADQAEGTWEPLEGGASLTASEVPTARGPVLGHAHPC